MEPQLPQPLEALKISNHRIDFAAAGTQFLEKYSGQPSAGAGVTQGGIDLAAVPVHKEPHAYKESLDSEKIYLMLGSPTCQITASIAQR